MYRGPLEVEELDGWLHNGRAASMLCVLELVPPQLIDWVLRQAFEVVADEELTSLDVELARVILVVGAVADLVGELDRRSRRSVRRRLPGRRAAA